MFYLKLCDTRARFKANNARSNFTIFFFLQYLSVFLFLFFKHDSNMLVTVCYFKYSCKLLCQQTNCNIRSSGKCFTLR